MDKYMEFFKQNQHISKISFSFLWFIIIIFLMKIIYNILFKYIKDIKKYHKIKRRIFYIFISIYTIILIIIWAGFTENLTTYIGLLSAGIAIAIKNVFTNIAAWMFIIFRKPFKVGNRIIINEYKGDVIDIRVFQFTLMEVTSQENGEQSTGRIIDIPNHFIFTYPLINYTKEFEYIWNEIKVLISFDSDWVLAKKLFTEIVNKHALHLSEKATEQLKEATKKYIIHYSILTPIVYTDVKESGIELSLRYLCQPKQRRTITNNIWEDILKILKEYKDIELAYPTISVKK